MLGANKFGIIAARFAIFCLAVVACLPWAESAAAEPAHEEPIEQLIRERMERFRIPGLAAAIVNGEGDVITKGFGYADLTDKTAVTPQTLFELGSTTKAFTAIAVLQLRDQGLISLEAPVSDYLPWFETIYQGDKATITIEQLLRHTSGIPADSIRLIPADSNKDALERTVRSLSGLKLSHAPGSKFEYATFNYDILGLIVQQQSGIRFEDYMRERIFVPLGLNATAFEMPDNAEERLAAGYKPAFGRHLRYRAPDYYGNRPAAYAISNAEDMGRWLQLQMGLVKPLDGSFNDKLLYEAQQPDPGGNYAYGWYNSLGVIEHYGANPNYSSYVLFRPREKIGVALLANTSSTNLAMIGKDVVGLLTGTPTREQAAEDFFLVLDRTASRVIYAAAPVTLLFAVLHVKPIRAMMQNRRRWKRLRWYHYGFAILSLIALFVIAGCLYVVPIVLQGVTWPFAYVWGPVTFTYAALFLLLGTILMFSYLTLMFLTTTRRKDEAERDGNRRFRFGDEPTAREAADYSSRSIVIRMMKLGKAHLGSYLGVCLLLLAASPLGPVLAEAYRKMVNATASRDVGLLAEAVLLAVAAVVAQMAVAMARTYWAAKLDNHTVLHVQTLLYSKMLRWNMADYNRRHTGDLIQRLSHSAEAAQAGFNGSSLQLLGNALQVVFMLAYLCYLHAGLTLGALLLSLALPIAFGPLSKKLRSRYDESQRLTASHQSFVQECIQGAEVVRSFGLAERMSRKFEQMYDRILASARAIVIYEGLLFRSQMLLQAGGLFFILGYGGALVIRGALDVGALVAFLVSFHRLTGPISALGGNVARFQESVSHAQRMFEILDIPDERTAEHSRMNLTGAVPEIEDGRTVPASATVEFEDVTFCYGEADPVIRGMTFTAEAGKTTAVIGPSGSGKSTILKLLMGFYLPQSGSIRCGGTVLGEIPLPQWRRKFAYVPQDPHLFSGSLYDNLKIGNPDATFDEIVAAAKAANIHDWIAGLPSGYESRIGDRGLSLSGGERQRISIARAFLKQADILILDEHTSALDSENEWLLLQALESLTKGKTTLVVAHRLSAIRNADRIVCVDNGTVQEAGTHAQLLERKGMYYRLYLKQEERTDESVRTHARMALGTEGGLV